MLLISVMVNATSRIHIVNLYKTARGQPKTVMFSILSNPPHHLLRKVHGNLRFTLLCPSSRAQEPVRVSKKFNHPTGFNSRQLPKRLVDICLNKQDKKTEAYYK